MRKIALLVFAAGMGLAGTASAADMAARPVYTKAPVAPVWSWTGSYIGGFVGGAWSDPSASIPVNGAGVPLPGVTGIASYNLGSSFIGGYTGGYNYQFAPNWLIGYEGETGYMHLKGSGVYPGGLGLISQTETGSLYSVWAARFGYVMDKSLFYVKGGGVLTQFQTDIFNPAGTVLLEQKKYKFSYAVGGGWEYAFDPKWSVKAEYLYLGYDNESISSTGNSAGIRGAVTQEFATTNLQGIHTVKVGLNYKWDWFSLIR